MLTYIYHERQQMALCGQHALNNLVQSSFFSADVLARHADELDQAELRFYAENNEGGVNNKDFQARLREGSGNVDDAGNFSIQVLRAALQKAFGLNLVSISSSEMRSSSTDLTTLSGFILNRSNHWFTVRLINDNFWVLDSLKERPERISHFRLAAELQAYTDQGYCVFAASSTSGEQLPKPPEEEWELERGRAECWWKEEDLKKNNTEQAGARLDTDVWRNLGTGVRLDAGSCSSATTTAADAIDLTGEIDVSQMSEEAQMELAIAASMQTATAETEVALTPEPDDGPNVVKIQIRMPAGGKAVRRFHSESKVGEIYAYVKEQCGSSAQGKVIEIKAFFPPKNIADLKTEKIKNAKLAGEALSAILR
jgi:ataxin-3